MGVGFLHKNEVASTSIPSKQQTAKWTDENKKNDQKESPLGSALMASLVQAEAIRDDFLVNAAFQSRRLLTAL
jgi:hypothetical protein